MENIPGPTGWGIVNGNKMTICVSHGMSFFIALFLINMPINVAYPTRINIMSVAIFCLRYDTPFDYTELSSM